MSVTRAFEDIYAVDPGLQGVSGMLSLYVVDAAEPALVDTGTAESVPAIRAGLDELGIAPEDVTAVFVSHVHLDHAGGAGHLASVLPNATFYIHERGYPYLTEADTLSRLQRSVDKAMGTKNAYGEPVVLDSGRCLSVSGGETVDLGDREVRLVDAPGHAPHHYAVYDEKRGALFTIDAAGMYLDGDLRPTTPPPSFDLEASVETARRLRALQPERNLYGHFGPGGEDAVGELRRYKRLLPAWVETVRERRAQHGDDVAAIVESLGPDWQSPTVARDVAGVLSLLDGDEA